MELLGDRRRLLEERERGLGVALLQCLECLRDEQVADDRGIESVLVDEPPGKSREPAAGDRHLARRFADIIPSQNAMNAANAGSPASMATRWERDMSEVAAAASPLRCAACPACPRSAASSAPASWAAANACAALSHSWGALNAPRGPPGRGWSSWRGVVRRHSTASSDGPRSS